MQVVEITTPMLLLTDQEKQEAHAHFRQGLAFHKQKELHRGNLSLVARLPLLKRLFTEHGLAEGNTFKAVYTYQNHMIYLERF